LHSQQLPSLPLFFVVIRKIAKIHMLDQSSLPSSLPLSFFDAQAVKVYMPPNNPNVFAEEFPF